MYLSEVFPAPPVDPVPPDVPELPWLHDTLFDTAWIAVDDPVVLPGLNGHGVPWFGSTCGKGEGPPMNPPGANGSEAPVELSVGNGHGVPWFGSTCGKGEGPPMNPPGANGSEAPVELSVGKGHGVPWFGSTCGKGEGPPMNPPGGNGSKLDTKSLQPPWARLNDSNTSTDHESDKPGPVIPCSIKNIHHYSPVTGARTPAGIGFQFVDR